MLSLKLLFKRKKVRYGVQIMPNVVGEVKPRIDSTEVIM